MGRRIIAQILMLGAAAASMVAAWMLMEQAFVEDWPAELRRTRGLEVDAWLMTHLPWLYAGAGVWLLGYLISFSRSRKRPRVAVLLGLAGVGTLAAVLARIAAYPMDFTTDIPARDGLFWYLLAGCVLLPPTVVAVFELANGALWTALARRADEAGKDSVAIFLGKLTLLFRPGQRAMLGAIALSDFRKGDRADAPKILEELYADGRREPELLEALCQYTYETKQPDKYLEYLRALQSMDPDDPVLRQGLFDELVDQGKADEAIAFAEESPLPDDLDVQETFAVVLSSRGKYERAVEIAAKIARGEGIPFRRSQTILRDVLSHASEFIPALNLLAEQAERQGLKEQRLRWLERSYTADPRQPLIREALRTLLKSLGQNNRLRQILEEVVAENPSDGDTWEELLQLQMDLGNADSVLTEVDRFHKKHAPTVRTKYLLAQIYFDRDDREKAKLNAEEALALDTKPEVRKAIEQLLARIERAQLTSELSVKLEEARSNPKDLPLQMDVLRHLLRGGHVDRLIGQVDSILRHHPSARGEVITLLDSNKEAGDPNYRVLELLAGLQVQAGDLDAALATIDFLSRHAMDPLVSLREETQKILRKSPHHLPTLKLLGERHEFEGRFTEMIHYYTLYIAHGGLDTTEMSRALSLAYVSLGDYGNARKHTTMLMARSGEPELKLLRRIIPLAIEHGSPEDAADYMKMLEKLDPRSDETAELRRVVAEGLGNKRLAFLQREVEAGKGGAELLEQLGDLARDLERFNDAITYYQRASREPTMARRCKTKLAWVFARKRLHDVAAETLSEVQLSLSDDPAEMTILMDLIYEIAVMFQEAKLHDRSLRLFKLLMKIDAGYRDVLRKVENLT